MTKTHRPESCPGDTGTIPLDRDVRRGGIEQGLNRWHPLIILCDRHSGIDIAFVTAQP
jgi:hypothetical protein